MNITDLKRKVYKKKLSHATLLRFFFGENFDVVFNDLNLDKSRYGRYNNYYKRG